MSYKEQKLENNKEVGEYTPLITTAHSINKEITIKGSIQYKGERKLKFRYRSFFGCFFNPDVQYAIAFIVGSTAIVVGYFLPKEGIRSIVKKANRPGGSYDFDDLFGSGNSTIPNNSTTAWIRCEHSYPGEIKDCINTYNQNSYLLPQIVGAFAYNNLQLWSNKIGKFNRTNFNETNNGNVLNPLEYCIFPRIGLGIIGGSFVAAILPAIILDVLYRYKYYKDVNLEKNDPRCLLEKPLYYIRPGNPKIDGSGAQNKVEEGWLFWLLSKGCTLVIPLSTVWIMDAVMETVFPNSVFHPKNAALAASVIKNMVNIGPNSRSSFFHKYTGAEIDTGDPAKKFTSFFLEGLVFPNGTIPEVVGGDGSAMREALELITKEFLNALCESIAWTDSQELLKMLAKIGPALLLLGMSLAIQTWSSHRRNKMNMKLNNIPGVQVEMEEGGVDEMEIIPDDAPEIEEKKDNAQESLLQGEEKKTSTDGDDHKSSDEANSDTDDASVELTDGKIKNENIEITEEEEEGENENTEKKTLLDLSGKK
jgi:hypothetical protein